jgi:hypothetical protein
MARALEQVSGSATEKFRSAMARSFRSELLSIICPSSKIALNLGMGEMRDLVLLLETLDKQNNPFRLSVVTTDVQ